MAFFVITWWLVSFIGSLNRGENAGLSHLCLRLVAMCGGFLVLEYYEAHFF